MLDCIWGSHAAAHSSFGQVATCQLLPYPAALRQPQAPPEEHSSFGEQACSAPFMVLVVVLVVV